MNFNKIGDVRMAQGDLAGALRSYREGLAIRDRLAKSEPDNSGPQYDLSTSFGKLASVFKSQNNRAEARDALTQGRDILLRLTRLAPENTVWKQDLDRFEAQLNELAR